ncbi:helix-turn-helix domain-containing protein, partial [Actinomadura rugatobispora]
MPIVDLSKRQRSALESVVGEGGYDGSVAARAQIVLWWADGRSVAEIVRLSGATKPTVYKWLDRYERSGLDGLIDLERPGRPRGISQRVRSRIVALTRTSPPERLGARVLCPQAQLRSLRRRGSSPASRGRGGRHARPRRRRPGPHRQCRQGPRQDRSRRTRHH